MSPSAAPEQLPQIYHRVARIAAATAKSEAGFVTLRIGRKLCIIGTHGTFLGGKQGNWDDVPAMGRIPNMTFIANVRRDANFKNHPLLTAAPFMRNLVHVPVHGHHADVEASISLANIGMKWPLTATVTGILTELAMLVGDAIEMDKTFPQEVGPSSATPEGFSEARTASPAPDASIDTSGKFLLSTLLNRTSIRNRKDVAFITLRTWSKTIKDHQIKALTIAKKNPDGNFVDAIAEEIAQQVRKIFGNPRFSVVVPVPCGHSKEHECLSVQIARRVAQLLEVPFDRVFEHVDREGTSHPRKNVMLKPPKLKSTQKFESVLVLDDVATSGRHIELSVMSLRRIADHIAALAWIGPN
ncbi:MAG: hypothetical protein IKE66_11175 [Hyphomicrobium sp.]|nr:hypothetical protein [Hyphomicrobium sp.]